MSNDSDATSQLHDDSDTDQFLETASKAFISTHSTVQDASKLELKGRCVVERGCTLHTGDARISLGQYSYLQAGTSVRPPEHVSSRKAIHVTVGAYTTIGAHCDIQAAAIGSNCVIGDHVTLGKRVIIKDNCYIADGTALREDTVVPPLTRLQPSPRPDLQWSWPYMIELPLAVQTINQQAAVEKYEEFAARRRQARQ